MCDFRPDAFSWDKVVTMNPVQRLDHAFTFAKDQLGIEKLLDPEGTVVLSTFVTQVNIIGMFLDVSLRIGTCICFL